MNSSLWSWLKSVREMWVYVCEQMWKHTSLCRLIGFPIYQQLCHNPTYLPPRDPKADLPSPITSLPNVQLCAYLTLSVVWWENFPIIPFSMLLYSHGIISLSHSSLAKICKYIQQRLAEIFCEPVRNSWHVKNLTYLHLMEYFNSANK